MRLASLKDGSVIIISKEGIVNLSEIGFGGSMLGLIEEGPAELKRIKHDSDKAVKTKGIENEGLAAPIDNPSKIVAIGLNYIDHAKESKMDLPTTPLVFAKFSSSITGPSDPIVIPHHLTKEVDYEAELGVVIGRRARNVHKEKALDYVFGYTVINDVSARDLQFADKQWVRAKSLDTFCPMGPVIVTADEIPDPQNLDLGCDVNGVKLQHNNTSNMIFGVAELISSLSHSFTLQPGDVIATGTPSGVGFSRKPPVFLKHGDLVRTWIKGIGELLNSVTVSSAGSRPLE